MDGYELADAIRREEPAGKRTPIIAFTANALRDEELRCLAAGMDGYLSKPVRLAQLKAAIELWLPPSAPRPVGAIDGTSATARPLVADLAVLMELVGDDPATVSEVLQAFRKAGDISRSKLDEALAAGAWPAVADVAHQLKGAALSIGAVRLGDLCGAIERSGTAANVAEVNALLEPFTIELESVIAFAASRSPA